jgi:hypothetical protein
MEGWMGPLNLPDYVELFSEWVHPPPAIEEVLHDLVMLLGTSLESAGIMKRDGAPIVSQFLVDIMFD